MSLSARGTQRILAPHHLATGSLMPRVARARRLPPADDEMCNPDAVHSNPGLNGAPRVIAQQLTVVPVNESVDRPKRVEITREFPDPLPRHQTFTEPPSPHPHTSTTKIVPSVSKHRILHVDHHITRTIIQLVSAESGLSLRQRDAQLGTLWVFLRDTRLVLDLASVLAIWEAGRSAGIAYKNVEAVEGFRAHAYRALRDWKQETQRNQDAHTSRANQVSRLLSLLVEVPYGRRCHNGVLETYRFIRRHGIVGDCPQMYCRILKALFNAYISSNSAPDGHLFLNAVREVINFMTSAGVVVDALFLTTLVQCLTSTLRVSIGRKHDSWREIMASLNMIRNGRNVQENPELKQSSVIFDLAWLEAILTLREEYQAVRQRNDRKTSYGSGFDGLRDYTSTLRRISVELGNQNLLSPRLRIPIHNIPQYTPKDTFYIPPTSLNARRLQLLIRDRLLARDTSTAFAYFCSLSDIVNASLEETPDTSQTPQSRSRSRPHRHNYASTSDLSRRLLGTYVRLISYALSNRDLPLLNEVLHLGVNLTRPGQSYERTALLLRVWKRSFRAMSHWRASWEGQGGWKRALSTLAVIPRNCEQTRHAVRKQLFSRTGLLARLVTPAIEDAELRMSCGKDFRKPLLSLLKILQRFHVRMPRRFLRNIQRRLIAGRPNSEANILEICSFMEQRWKCIGTSVNSQGGAKANS